MYADQCSEDNAEDGQFDMRELFKEKMMHKSSAVCMLSGLSEVELIEKIRDAVASGRVVV